MLKSNSENNPTESAVAGKGLLALWDLCKFLRSAEGCPWDQEQTLASLTPYMVEETYEVLESVSSNDLPATAEELGDLLFLLILCSEMVHDQNGPDLDRVALLAKAKLERRHPFLFEKREEITTSDQQRRWHEIKQSEQGTKSILGKMPSALPSLTAAFRTQEKAASVGFDWTQVEDVIAKIEEELGEVKEALREQKAGRDLDSDRTRALDDALHHEIGDLLFAVANLSRFLRVDPERELRATIKRFRARFLFIEEELEKLGTAPKDSSLEEMDRLWNQAKEIEKKERS